jgi:hypothetical protein
VGDPVPPFFGVDTTPDGSNFSPFFEGDVIEAALSLDVSTDTFAFFGNYGLTSRWDIGLVVPIVRVDLDARVHATILRLATVANPQIHSFEAGNPAATERDFTRAGSASGLGDLLVRTKYRVFDLTGGGLAVAADFRLPTGDEENLLGGSAQTKLMLVVSGGGDRIAQHVNFGYTFSGAAGSALAGAAVDDFPDEVGYAAGLEVVVDPRVTIIGDVVGRVLRDAGRLDLASKTFQFILPGPPAPPMSAEFQEFEPRAGNINLLFGTAGVKFNPAGNLLLSASVLFPLNDSGLKSKVAGVFGFDYAF